MFLSLFKQKENSKKRHAHVAEGLYVSALDGTRNEIFYTRYGVPDTFDGRYDLLLLHMFIILHSIMDHPDYPRISQALFDTIFKNMDQTLREMGIGDVGVPKHLKRMMKAFNGRMHSYQWAIAPDTISTEGMEDFDFPKSLADALKRNLYGTTCEQEGWNEDVLLDMEKFVRINLSQSDKALILSGAYNFTTPPQE